MDNEITDKLLASVMYGGLSVGDSFGIYNNHTRKKEAESRKIKLLEKVGFDDQDRLYIKLKVPRISNDDTLSFYNKGECVVGFDPIHCIEETDTEYHIYQYDKKNIVNKNSYDEIRLTFNNSDGFLQEWDI